MSVVANILVLLIAALHIYILVLEMFLWEQPRTRAAFGTDRDFATKSKALAANQGLYNGFLAAGLIWAVLVGGSMGRSIAEFFLVCVIIAGVYGAATASRRIIFVQSLPAAIALVAVLLSK